MSGHAGEALYSDDIRAFFVRRGWVRRAGGDLYFNGLGTTSHPHLHMIVSTTNESGGRLRQESENSLASDLRRSITMLAFSDGQQHRGGGGQTAIRDYELTQNWTDVRSTLASRAAMYAEFNWIVSYWTEG